MNDILKFTLISTLFLLALLGLIPAVARLFFHKRIKDYYSDYLFICGIFAFILFTLWGTYFEFM